MFNLTTGAYIVDNRPQTYYVEYWSNGREQYCKADPTTEESQAYAAERVKRQNERDMSVPDPIVRFEAVKPLAVNSFGYRQRRAHARPRMGRR